MNTSFKAALRRAAAAVCGAVLALSAAPAVPAQAEAAQAVHTDVSKDIGLVGNLFCISGSYNADHSELQWATNLKSD